MNFLGNYLVDQFGSGTTDDDGNDVRAVYHRSILKDGKSWGVHPDAPSCGSWIALTTEGEKEKPKEEPKKDTDETEGQKTAKTPT